jgi:outer membrane usher protein
VDNQPVGTTDHKGRVLVDQLRPYEANEISLDPTALPMDATLSTAAINVTPAYRSGALVRFPVSRGDAAILRLQQESGTHVPPGAEVTINGATFPVALNGLVQVAGVADRAAAIAQWRDGRCEFEVVRPASDDPVPDLGTVVCRPLTGEAPQR